MATEVTVKSLGTGHLRGWNGITKAPGPGLIIKLVRFTTGTSEYPDGGYVAADLEALLGLTRIEAIVPCGFATNGSHETAFGVSWDGAARKLQLFSNFDADAAGATTIGALMMAAELPTNSAIADGAVFDALVIGY
jgi:hypothetical protein